MRVLLVDDDAAIARSIEFMLKVEEINVYRTDLGEEGVDLGKIYDYDIILLDLNLPDISGYEVLRSLRSAKVVTPVLILSGLASIEDKIRGLGLGADDYLSKPFHKDELIARIHALVRRSKGHAQSLIAVGDLIVNLEARNVELHGQKLHLTAKEYQILALLALRTGSTLTKETFLNHLYGHPWSSLPQSFGFRRSVGLRCGNVRLQGLACSSPKPGDEIPGRAINSRLLWPASQRSRGRDCEGLAGAALTPGTSP